MSEETYLSQLLDDLYDNFDSVVEECRDKNPKYGHEGLYGELEHLQRRVELLRNEVIEEILKEAKNKGSL